MQIHVTYIFLHCLHLLKSFEHIGTKQQPIFGLVNHSQQFACQNGNQIKVTPLHPAFSRCFCILWSSLPIDLAIDSPGLAEAAVRVVSVGPGASIGPGSKGSVAPTFPWKMEEHGPTVGDLHGIFDGYLGCPGVPPIFEWHHEPANKEN